MISGCKQLDELVAEHARRRAAAEIGRRMADNGVRAVLAKFAPMRANVEAVCKLEAEGTWARTTPARDPQAPMIDPRLFNDPLGLRSAPRRT